MFKVIIYYILVYIFFNHPLIQFLDSYNFKVLLSFEYHRSLFMVHKYIDYSVKCQVEKNYI